MDGRWIAAVAVALLAAGCAQPVTPQATSSSPPPAIVDGHEPNDDRAHATPGSAVMRDLSLPAGDIDWVQYNFTAGGNATFVAGSGEAGGVSLRLVDAGGQELAKAAPRQKGSGSETVLCIRLAVGTYAMEAASATGAPVGRYYLSATLSEELAGTYCR